ncbi:intraflagellar transport protein osm-1 [Ditylenchus destructor]|nr:intraflagellar transport protein osm-1 [Ditylenchus destructor]
MQLKYLDTLVDPTGNEELVNRCVPSITYSPNGKKLAIVSAERYIILLDEKFRQRDKFSTKPIDSKYGKKSYVLRSAVFSPDSTKLAVGQTDSIVFVYRLGHSWDEKKVICNKFAQKDAAVTALIWPEENRLIIGLVDGKVRNGSSNSNKCSTIYKTDSMVVALAQHPNKQSFSSGHVDGSIIVYSFKSRTQQKLCVHSTSPYCLVFSNFGILAAGSDRRIISYNAEQGRILQDFDYSRDANEKEFYVAAIDSTGHNAVFGTFDKFRLVSWNARRGAWDAEKVLNMRNFYTVSSLAWKPDGTTLIAGSIVGGVCSIDCCMKRSLLKNRFETTYVSPSQVVIKDVNSPEERSCVIRSKKNHSITDIRIMGRTNRYAIASTPYTMVLADLENDLCSEIAWDWSGNERYYLDNENVCMIVNAGCEVSFVEYGKDEVAGWIRTERVNPHQISVRINEKKYRRIGRSGDKAEEEDIRRVAYLLDIHTISIVNLIDSRQLAQISHNNSVIDWMELNESANKLLYRDHSSSLFLFRLETGQTSNMVNFCSFVQWVPRSDVVVAQSNDMLCVWYNTDFVEQITQFPIQGDIEMVLRDDRHTEVIVQENNAQVAYELDIGLIEFGTALDELDFNRALIFLEQMEESSGDSHAGMWKRLAFLTMEHSELLIAQRCYAALNDYARVKFLQETIEKAEIIAQRHGGNGLDHYEIRARMAMSNKEYKLAERIYLENNALKEAIEMHQKLSNWEAAIDLAQAMNYPDLESLKAKYHRNLRETGQEDKAAEIKAKEGDINSALEIYLNSNQPAMAAKILMENSTLKNDESLVERVVLSLIKCEIFDKAGEMLEEVKQFQRSMECYKRGKAFSKAIHVARFSFPEQVVQLEEAWGDSLCQEGNFDAAISHYLESGNSLKAAQGDYSTAEKLYIDANLPMEAVEMYNRAGKWIDAYKLAAEFFGIEGSKDLYLQKAESLEQSNRLKDAEELYVQIGEPNRAIQMYKSANRLEEMMVLVERFHSEKLQDTHKRLAEELEKSGDLKAAEEQYLLAGDWTAAMNMYKEAEQWADAYRIAKFEGGDRAHKQIAYLWAMSLGGDAAIKLLTRHALLQEAIELGTTRGDFEFVFELCRLGANNKLAYVQQKYAERLEDEGDLSKAEEYYLKAGKGKDAILMYIHNQNWEAAERIASLHSTDMLVDVYISQARAALEEKNLEKAESYLLRANRADIMLTYYREMGMWTEALRIAREYVPDMLAQVQNEFDDYQLKSGAMGAQSFMAQAKEWEHQKEYRRAVEAYMKVDESSTSDTQLIVQAYSKAGELIVKFLMDEMGLEVIDLIGTKLMILHQYMAAGELYLLANMPHQAIEALISAREWAKAKRVASELSPELEDHVDERYREFLKNQGRVGELIDVDVVSAIDILIENGQWEKALMTAKQQNHRSLLDRYLITYVTELFKTGEYVESAKLLIRFGVSSNPENFNIYKKIIDNLINKRDCSYDTIALLRDMVHNVNESVQTADGVDTRIIEVFNRYEYALHFYALSKALESIQGEESVDRLRLCINIALVRYVDLFQPDKVFLEAGTACKNFGEEYMNLAFVFLNHYLDIADSIVENDPNIVDNSVFQDTDIPQQYSIPDKMYLSSEEHEEVKEWVLAISVGHDVNKELKVDERGCYEASTVDLDGNTYETCVFSGYPVITEQHQAIGLGKVANSWAWSVFSSISKTQSSDELFDVQQFVNKWTGAQS